MKFLKIWILLTLEFVWIVLKESKQKTHLIKKPQQAHNFLKLYTLIFVDLFVEKSIILSHLLMISHIMDMMKMVDMRNEKMNKLYSNCN